MTMDVDLSLLTGFGEEEAFVDEFFNYAYYFVLLILGPCHGERRQFSPLLLYFNQLVHNHIVTFNKHAKVGVGDCDKSAMTANPL